MLAITKRGFAIALLAVAVVLHFAGQGDPAASARRSVSVATETAPNVSRTSVLTPTLRGMSFSRPVTSVNSKARSFSTAKLKPYVRSNI